MLMRGFGEKALRNFREMALLELTDISKTYRSPGDGVAADVLHEVSLSLEAGSSTAIVGPSGSGKTTLLNVIGGLDRPTSGTVLLGGADLSAMDDKALARVRNEQIGFVFQAHHLLPQLSVLENVLVPTVVLRDAARKQSAGDRAKALLDRVGLGHRLSNRPGQLSGGERQRAAVVRALINEPKLLLADEPTGALDQANAQRLVDLLVELNREEGVTLVMVTHAMDQAKRMSTVRTIRDGRLGGEGG